MKAAPEALRLARSENGAFYHAVSLVRCFRAAGASCQALRPDSSRAGKESRLTTLFTVIVE